jgi:hypothetical protein
MTENGKSDFERPISLKQLADELGFHSSSIRKIVIRRGFAPFRLSEGNNKPLYLKASDAESFKQQILNEQNNRVVPKAEISSSRISGVYLIEVPSYEGKNRFKIGWSDNLSDRLSTYRTIIPDLHVKAVWQTSDSWCERAALKCAARLGPRVHQELFEFENISSVLSELNDLFLKMGIKNKNLKTHDKAQPRDQADRQQRGDF